MQELPKFITLEGGDGAGKSTQIQMLKSYFEKQKIACLFTKEPGGSVGADEIRQILINGQLNKWDAVSETLLFYASRRAHLVDTIWPALKAGKWVISDRFADSTLAYQVYGRQSKLITKEQVADLYHLVAGDFKPDLTIILDIDPKVGLNRVSQRGQADRFEASALAFHERLREGFKEIAAAEPKRCVVINADNPPEMLHREIVRLIEDRFS